jgi:dihydrofolate synthase / folylpolyglutamate synthase
MAVSDAILTRLLTLHPKIIDLSLERVWRLLNKLGHPEQRLPPVIHVAGTNGKGSTCAYLQAMLEAARLRVHVYTSPHLVRFHERIRLASGPGESDLIAESDLNALLQECEEANSGEPITFFEITTAAAFLAFSRMPADYTILEVGLGGRLDATNTVEQPKATVITAIDYDHQQYLGDTLPLIAREKAGVLKRGAPGIIGRQGEEALEEIERCARAAQAPLFVAGRDWMSFEQNGRLVFQDEHGLMDLPLPRLPGTFQIDNAGNAIATLRIIGDRRIADQHIAEGLRTANWPARMQRLGHGKLTEGLGAGSELWLDGGHNASAGKAVALTFAQLEERTPKPLILILGMLRTKDAAAYIRPFKGLAKRIIAVAVPGEPNSFPAEELAQIARAEGLAAQPAASIEAAIAAARAARGPARILIAGSLYLAGNVLAAHSGEARSAVSGAIR